MDIDKLEKANELARSLHESSIDIDLVQRFKEGKDTPTMVINKGSNHYPIVVNNYIGDAEVSSLCDELLRRIEKKIKEKKELLEKEFEEL